MIFNRKFVNIVGAGFAGIECALFLASHGVKVHVFDSGNVYEKDVFEEESNRFKEPTEQLLKRELFHLGSPLIKYALSDGNLSECQILEKGKEMLRNHENVSIFEACIHELNPNEVTVIATGSYTDEGMTNFLIQTLGGLLCQARMPLYPVFKNVDMSQLEKRGSDYLLGLSYEEYIDFLNSVIDEINLKGFKDELMFGSVEKLVLTGKENLRNWSMRPVLTDKNSKNPPFATIKFKKTEKGLLAEGLGSEFDKEAQARIFTSLKGLKNASIVKHAKMLKVCYISSPFALSIHHQALVKENLFFAGSILGITGYVDCIASGLYTALNVLKFMDERPMVAMPKETVLGALSRKVIARDRIMGQFVEDYGLITDKDLKNENLVEDLEKRSINALAKFKEEYNGKHV